MRARIKFGPAPVSRTVRIGFSLSLVSLFQGQAADRAQMGALPRAKAILTTQHPFRKNLVPHLRSLLMAVGAPVVHREAYEANILAYNL